MKRNWLHVKVALFVLVSSLTFASKAIGAYNHDFSKLPEAQRERIKAVESLYRDLQKAVGSIQKEEAFFRVVDQNKVSGKVIADDTKIKQFKSFLKSAQKAQVLMGKYCANDDVTSEISTMMDRCISNMDSVLSSAFYSIEGKTKTLIIEEDNREIPQAKLVQCTWGLVKALDERAKKTGKEALPKELESLRTHVVKFAQMTLGVRNGIELERKFTEVNGNNETDADLKKQFTDLNANIEKVEAKALCKLDGSSETPATSNANGNEGGEDEEEGDEENTSKKDTTDKDRRSGNEELGLGGGGYEPGGRVTDKGRAPTPPPGPSPIPQPTPFTPPVGPGVPLDPGALDNNHGGGINDLLPALLGALGQQQQPIIEPQANRSATGGSKTENPPPPITPPTIAAAPPSGNQGGEQTPPPAEPQGPPPYDPSMFAQNQGNNGQNDLQQMMLAQALRDANKEREPRQTPTVDTTERDRALQAQREAEAKNMQFQNQLLAMQMQQMQQGQFGAQQGGLNGATAPNGQRLMGATSSRSNSRRSGYSRSRTSSRSRSRTSMSGTGQQSFDVLTRSGNASNVRGRISSPSVQ